MNTFFRPQITDENQPGKRKSIMKIQNQLTNAIGPVRNKLGFVTRKRTLAISTLVLLVTTAWAEASGTWSPTGSMAIGRFIFTATLLPNGKVLVAGGDTPGEIITNTAELYDPTTGTFTPTG